MKYRILLKIIFLFTFFCSFALDSKAYDSTCFASFTYIENNYGEFTFTNKSNCTSGQQVRFFWDFGDGTAKDSINANPVHRYKTSGYYTVHLTVIGKTDYTTTSTLRSIAVKGLCNYDFTIQKRDSVITINFPVLDKDPFVVDFGNSTKESFYKKSSVTHTYSKNGEYTVSLYSYYGYTCADTIRKKVIITDPVYCSATFNATINDFPARTVNAEVDYFAGENNSVYEWDFGDGIKKSGTAILKTSHTYTASGKYKISLKTTNTSHSCSDTFSKYITVTDPHFCYAGFKANLLNDFNRTVNLEIDSSNFKAKDSSFYRWDFGDGGKDSGIGKFKTSYKYAKDGTYKISLKTSNTKYNCTDTSSLYVTVKQLILPGTITGKIKAYDSSSNQYIAADNAIVYLIQYNTGDSSLNLADSVISKKDSSGIAKYTFTDVAPGKYLVKAALDKNSSYYSHNIPTYYISALKWSNADYITFTGEKISSEKTADISLVKGNNPGGKGFIGGKVVAGANKKEGDPLENIQVMLFDANTSAAVANTYSDKNGAYSFTNLAMGKYEVYAEVPGVETKSAFVTLTSTDTIFSSVIVKVSNDVITTEVLTGLKEVFADISQLSVYPNPANNNLYIQLENKKAQAISTEIFSIDGRKLLVAKHNIAPGNQVLNIDVQQLPAGTYMLMLKNTSSGEAIRYKFLKLK